MMRSRPSQNTGTDHPNKRKARHEKVDGPELGLPLRRDDAEEHAERNEENERRRHQQQCCQPGYVVDDKFLHWRAVAIRKAEIARDDLLEVQHVLRGQSGSIETILGSQPGELLAADVAFAGDERQRVARREMHHHEDEA